PHCEWYVLSPILAPAVTAVNPPPLSTVVLPLGSVRTTFDRDMFEGDINDPRSVLNPANYTLAGDGAGPLTVQGIAYEPASRTVVLSYEAIPGNQYRLIVSRTIESGEGIALAADFTSEFTAIGGLTKDLSLEFFNARSDRLIQTVSYEVKLTNLTSHDLLLPVLLELDPQQQFAGVPVDAAGQSPDGKWLIDLSQNLPGGVLAGGASTVGRTITVANAAGERVNFDPSVMALPGPNAAPFFTSRPVTSASADQAYSYQVTAIDPEGDALTYLLVRAPTGMTLDP